MTTCNVCIIDDDIVYQFTAKKLLQKIGEVKEIMVFSNGLEATKDLITNSNSPSSLPDIIFLDIRMPVMDGWTFLEQFKNVKSQMSKPIKIFGIRYLLAMRSRVGVRLTAA